MFEAATRAYADAGIDPRRDVDSFLSCSEDLNEGTSIFDEYVPDQIGAALRPVYTVGGDGIQGLATAYMQILSGVAEVVAVEAHSKASNILTPNHLLAFALDPIFVRPLGMNPHVVAGLEADAYMRATETTREQLAAVAAKNRRNALANPVAAYGSNVTVEDVLGAPPAFSPLSVLEVSEAADGAIVVVLASESRAKAMAGQPVWLRGVGWASDSHSLGSRDWAAAPQVRLAAEMAYRQAGVRDPAAEVDFAEVDDTYSYKELQALEALRLFRPGEAGPATEDSETQRDGEFPVNASGGSLGVGHLLEATGLQKVAEAVLQLRGQAGQRQLEDVTTGIAQSWRGVPTSTAAVAVLSVE
ncbi:MAG: acetyl-CoA acetyltransferase [Chloroflexi bacterium]|nr:acetyl-CoA acetyltransferase [Chloroflexota bacterium]